MDLEIFHEKLLGTTPSLQYRLTSRHKALYLAYEKGKHGYALPESNSREDPELFLATFVLAVHQTTFPEASRVVIAVARPVERWALEQIKTIARHIFSIRKGKSPEGIQMLKDAVHRLDLGSRVLQIDKEPPKWVAYGFHNQECLPPWMRGKLVKPPK